MPVGAGREEVAEEDTPTASGRSTQRVSALRSSARKCAGSSWSPR